ncbi:two-component system NtrC family response regulator [Desulfohalotomaculum tongense]|uniref:sigma-54-dependent transcriptional regulator n=1 Tax=Desulforadius tongensis TaxID=1216062 RepID=UPI0019581E4E|nr:sigma-54 dependent transcriptional regulator [Desulforadius tongensis]MBM7853977.1 two-component system NtrC family response regulator [Desulforadius tongensis]
MDYKANILVIDDEPEVGVFFRRLLESKGYRVGVAISGDEAEELWKNNNYQVALVDLKLPDVDGLTLLQKIKEHQPACEVIIMTGYATTKTAVKAIQLGAFDYVEKPFEDILEVETLVQKGVDYSTTGAARGGRPSWADAAEKVGLYYGQNKEMHRLMNIAAKIAPKNINVLIYGETGTGKEVLARFIHHASRRAGKEFVAVNCGAMPENLLESQLFGHEKGAFTGASSTHRGIFELANNGTLFLDEIGEASLAIQVKLLRVLETGEFCRVGGEKPIRTNVRIIAATNVDLEQAVLNKQFREDLFYRLDVIRLVLPTLKQRREDIPGLVHHFLKRLGMKEGAVNISAEVMNRLCSYCWPGNLRELLNTLNQAVALCDGDTILPSHLPSKILQAGKSTGVNTELTGTPAESNPVELIKNLYHSISESESISTKELLDIYQMIGKLRRNIKKILVDKGLKPEPPPSLRELEAQAIEDALLHFNGNVTAAAKALGVGRNTLYRKVKEYNIAAKN